MSGSTGRPARGKNMVRLPGGSFVMGDDAHYPEERPARRVDVGSFMIDEHPVTNAEFGRFVRATGYLSTAEQPPRAEDFPGADPADLVAGSLLFRPTAGPVPLDDWQRWWAWAPGASWRAPRGPGSTIGGFEQHPVIHVSYEDALAYCEWAGKALATEAEWEFAARGGGSGEYAWGDEFAPRGRLMANTWHGRFPWENHASDGFERTSPIGRFPPNGYGLLDMIGNVWEWTDSAWTADHSSEPATSDAGHCCAPEHTHGSVVEEDRRVMKGGSHLCAPSYCQRYRPAARQGQAVRSSTSHLGFRCIIRD